MDGETDLRIPAIAEVLEECGGPPSMSVKRKGDRPRRQVSQERPPRHPVGPLAIRSDVRR